MRLSPFRGVGLLLYKHVWIRVVDRRPVVRASTLDLGSKTSGNRFDAAVVDIDVMRYGTLVLLLTLTVLLVGALSACGGGIGGGY